MEDIFEVRRQALDRLIKLRYDGSQKAFAAAAKINPSYVTRMLKPAGEKDRKRIGEEMVRNIEDETGVDLMLFAQGSAALLTMVRPPTGLQSSVSGGSQREPVGASPTPSPRGFPGSVALDYAGLPERSRRVPVMLTARAKKDGSFEEIPHVNGDGWVPGVVDDVNAYAVRIRGDGWAPVLLDGTFLVVETDVEPEADDHVLLHFEDGRRMLMSYRSGRSDTISVETPDGLTRSTIERVDLQAIHVVTSYVRPRKHRKDGDDR